MTPTTNIDRMRVSGGTSPTAINGDHVLGATVNSRPSYVLASGIDVIWSGTYWEIRSGSTARWRSASPHGTLPSDVAVWTAQNASTGTIAVAALSRGADPLIASDTPATPDAAVELIAAGTPATPTEAGSLVAGGVVGDAINGMRVSGSTSPTNINTDFNERNAFGNVQTQNGRPKYIVGLAFAIEWTGTVWSVKDATSRWESASPHGTLPSDVAVWTAVNGSTGTLSVTRLEIRPAAAVELIDSGTPATPDAPGSLV